jgi:regulation of enolase protein 1 (concanavalin A-like superfamily)
MGRWGEGEICFGGCLDSVDLIIGRGSLDRAERDIGRNSVHTRLRLERSKGSLRALCSADGEKWFSVGVADMPKKESWRVGLHAIGYIDRTIYHGAYSDGTGIRFRSFQIGF